MIYAISDKITIFWVIEIIFISFSFSGKTTNNIFDKTISFHLNRFHFMKMKVLKSYGRYPALIYFPISLKEEKKLFDINLYCELIMHPLFVFIIPSYQFYITSNLIAIYRQSNIHPLLFYNGNNKGYSVRRSSNPLGNNKFKHSMQKKECFRDFNSFLCTRSK